MGRNAFAKTVYVDRAFSELASIVGKTNNPRALALAFGGGSIKSAAEEYLAGVYPGTKIPVEDYEKGEITAENIHRVEEDIRKLKEKYQTANVTEYNSLVSGISGTPTTFINGELYPMSGVDLLATVKAMLER